MPQPSDPRYSQQAAGGVDDALQELDREMRELQQKMDALRRQPQQQAYSPPQRPAQPAPQQQPQRPVTTAAPAQQAPPPAQQPAVPQAPAPQQQPQQPQRQQAQQQRQPDWVDSTTSDLRRLREGLNRLAAELSRAVDELTSSLEGMRSGGSQPAPPAQQQPAQAPADPVLPEPGPEPVLYEEPEYSNAIEIDAGPFDDLVALSRFEQALADLPGVEDVYVKAYGKGRAVIELTVDDRGTIVDEMYVHLPYQLDAGQAPDGKVVVHLHAAAVEQPEA